MTILDWYLGLAQEDWKEANAKTYKGGLEFMAKQFSRLRDELDAEKSASNKEIAALKDQLHALAKAAADLTVERDELRTVLDAWASVFGSSQLSHASAAESAAESAAWSAAWSASAARSAGNKACADAIRALMRTERWKKLGKGRRRGR